MKKLIAALVITIASIHPALGGQENNRGQVFKAESFDVLLDEGHRENFGDVSKVVVQVNEEKMALSLGFNYDCPKGQYCIPVVPVQELITLKMQGVYRNHSPCSSATYQATVTKGNMLVDARLVVADDSADCNEEGGLLELTTVDLRNPMTGVRTSTILLDVGERMGLPQRDDFTIPDTGIIKAPTVVYLL